MADILWQTPMYIHTALHCFSSLLLYDAAAQQPLTCITQHVEGTATGQSNWEHGFELQDWELPYVVNEMLRWDPQPLQSHFFHSASALQQITRGEFYTVAADQIQIKPEHAGSWANNPRAMDNKGMFVVPLADRETFRRALRQLLSQQQDLLPQPTEQLPLQHQLWKSRG